MEPSDIWLPPRLRRREWMFMPWGDGATDRHRSFTDAGALHSYLCQRFPHSCFHSTAYYDDPSQRTMAEKGWRGADLIFDLDGDHLHGISPTDFPNLISAIQDQTWSLWNDFLEPEFGFKESFLQVTFSGHRGFHLHYRDPALFHLDSEARRELVSFIRGEGVDVQGGLTRFHDPIASGWTKRIRQQIPALIDKLVLIAQDADGAGKEGREYGF